MSNPKMDTTPSPSDEEKEEFIDAIFENDIDKVEDMLNRNSRLLNTKSHGVPLIDAAGRGHDEIVRLFLGHVNINQKDKFNSRTPIIAALENERYETTKILLEAGANPNLANKDDETPMYYAMGVSENRFVKLLLKYGANPNIQIDKSGRKPLWYAIWKQNPEMVRLLLAKGANPNKLNSKDDKNVSPLAHIVEDDDDDDDDYDDDYVFKIVKLLLDAGADIKNSSARFIKFLYDNPREFPNKEYNKLIRKNFKPMNPRTNCEVDVFGGNYRLSKTNITRTSPSKPNRLLVWVAIPTPSNKKYERTEYDCLSLEKYIEIVVLKDNIHPITRKKIQTHRVRFYYVDPTAVKSAATKIQAVVRGHRTRSRIVKSRTNSNTSSSSSSRTNSRFGKGKGPQKRPSSTVCTRAQKLGVRLTLKRNNKRVYKSEEMLRKQIKNAVTKQNKRKQQKQKQKK